MFQCSYFDGILSDYLVLRKLVVGLHDPVLKCDIFQHYSEFNHVNSLYMKCSSFKAAERDAKDGAKSKWHECSAQ